MCEAVEVAVYIAGAVFSYGLTLGYNYGHYEVLAKKKEERTRFFAEAILVGVVWPVMLPVQLFVTWLITRRVWYGLRFNPKL